MPPRSKKLKRDTSNLSSELGDGNFAIDYNANGRAIRKCRTARRASPLLFEDSAVAISDPESELDVETEDGENDDVIAVRRRPGKRKRSLSPPAPLLADPLADFSEASLSDMEDVRGPPPPIPSTGSTIHLTVNIPAGHTGPITLNLDPKHFVGCQPGHTPTAKPDRLAQSTLARINTRSIPKSKKYAGFLDLPAELRNDIYRMVFVQPDVINFSRPDNFCCSAAFLRTCRQVHEEGRSILYSENSFAIERRTQRYGSLWENEWRELGYLNVRKFMKSIGPSNTALLRKLSFMLEDAVPCLNPAKTTNEDRRFVNDDDLVSVLRHLGDHAQLEILELHFHGRRRVDRSDDRFLDYMKRLKADSVKFIDWPPGSLFPRQSKQDESVKCTLLAHCTRKHKKFDV